MIPPKTIRREIDNGERKLGPLLIATGSVQTSPKITGERGIYQSGTQQMLDAVLEIISSAKDLICISSFMLQDSEIINEVEKAADRGVKVYMLTAAEQQVNSKYEDEGSGEAEKRKDAVELLKRLGHKVLIKTAEHLHSKFLLSDPRSAPRGIVFTNNLTVRALKENLELSVKLDPDGVRELFHQFLLGFWKESEREVWLEGTEFRLRPATKHPEFLIQEFSHKRLIWTSMNDQSLSKHLEDMINSAQHSIALSAWTFSLDSVVTQAIVKRAKEGLEVTVFTRPDKANAGFIKEIAAADGKVYCHSLLHAKSLIVDGVRGIIMTANFSPLGLDSGFETGVPLNDEQTKLLIEIEKEWKSRAQYHLVKSAAFKDIEREYLNVAAGMVKHEPPRKLIEVQEGNLEALSMADYKNNRYEFRKGEGKLNSIKEIHIYRLFPPRLPSGSKRTGTTEVGPFDLYENKGQKFLLVEEESTIDQAIDLEDKLGVRVVSKGQ